jgi:hypothetical protein
LLASNHHAVLVPRMQQANMLALVGTLVELWLGLDPTSVRALKSHLLAVEKLKRSRWDLK